MTRSIKITKRHHPALLAFAGALAGCASLPASAEIDRITAEVERVLGPASQGTLATTR